MHDGKVCRCPIQRQEVLLRQPLTLCMFGELQCPRFPSSKKRNELNRLGWIGMQHRCQGPANLNANRQLLPNLPNQASRRTFFGFYFSARKLPQSGQVHLLRALGGQNFLLMQKYKTGYVDDFHSKKRKGKGTGNKLEKNSLPIPLLFWNFKCEAMRS